MKKAARDLVVGDKTSTFEVMSVGKNEPFVFFNVKLRDGGAENRRYHNSLNNLLTIVSPEKKK